MARVARYDEHRAYRWSGAEHRASYWDTPYTKERSVEPRHRQPTYNNSRHKGWSTDARWRVFHFEHEGLRLLCHLREPPAWKLKSWGVGHTRRAPVLLYLHSASYAPLDDLFPEGDGWLDDAEIEPVYVLCPRCPEDYYWLLRGNSWNEEGGEWRTDDRGFCFWFAPFAADMAACLEQLLLQGLAPRAPAADLGRVCLAGASMGGNGCWELAAHRPELFAALAPVAAHLEEHRVSHVIEKLAGVLPVWCFHGVDDKCCPYDDMVSLVNKLGRDAWLTTYWEPRGQQSVHNSAIEVAFVEYGRQLISWFTRLRPRWEDKRSTTRSVSYSSYQW